MLTAYSSDGIYRYSLSDPPEDDETQDVTTPLIASMESEQPESSQVTSDSSEEGSSSGDDVSHDEMEADCGLSSDDEDDMDGPGAYSSVPTIMPQSRYAGICNVRTIKDGIFFSGRRVGLLIRACALVNFLGPNEEFVTSGSDDGHMFIWNKTTGALHDILEGDGSVVNVIEGHPHLPLIAVSGIDYTVKVRAFYPPPTTDSFAYWME